MDNEVKTMEVGRVVNQSDRTLIYESPFKLNDYEYHVIAPVGFTAKRGDVIKYEPYGFNFGWLIKDEEPQP